MQTHRGVIGPCNEGIICLSGDLKNRGRIGVEAAGVDTSGKDCQKGSKPGSGHLDWSIQSDDLTIKAQADGAVTDGVGSEALLFTCPAMDTLAPTNFLESGESLATGRQRCGAEPPRYSSALSLVGASPAVR